MPLATGYVVDDATLATWIRAALRAQRVAGAEEVTLVARSANGYISTFPSETVVVRLADGATLSLFCKHGGGVDHPAFGHRGGVAYEADVYRDVLERLPLTRARFYGAHIDPASNRATLFLEALDRVIRVGSTADVEMLARAARWAARCHALAERSPALSRLTRYDREYYQGWAARTARFAAALGGRYRWLGAAAGAYALLVDRLLAAPPTLVHGEFYSRNVLVRDGQIHPVDWESAAAGAGVIDLVSLVEGWPDDVATHCHRAYCSERWPGGAPEGFDDELRAARAYLHFRWLGDRVDWTTAPASEWRFAALESILLAART